MASGATEGESRRKHRRSSSPSLDDAERSSKKHKHRHHRHRHHRHRGSSRKGEEEGAYGAHGGDSPPIPPALSPPAAAAPSSMPDDEVEEGEILEEEAIEPVEEVNSENLVNNSDTGVMLAKRSPTFAAENSEAAVDEFHSAIAQDSRINGDLIYELSRKDVRLAHQSHSKGRGKEKNHYDVDSTENGESDISDSRKSLSNSNADGYKMSPCSPCSDRYGDDRHRSHDFGRERSRSRSSLRDDGSPSRRRHPLERESSYYSEKRRIEYDSDDQKVTQHNRDSRHSGRGFVKDEEREWFTSHSRYDNVEYPHPSRERSSRDKNTGRDVDVEWKREERERKDRDTDRKRTERERSIGRELEWNRRRERERERERERSRERAMDKDRRREMEREKSIERGREGDRRREKERDKSRDRDRVRESKRDKDSERERERVREKSRERSWKSERFDERDSDVRRDVHIISKYKKFEDGYAYEDKHKYSKNSRGNESERNHDKIRKEDHSTVDASIIGGIKDDKVHRRDVDEQDDLDEPYALDLAEQEEEDLNRIKEESRRRREAIMEKYKNQKQQQQQQQQEQQQQQQQQQEPVQPNSEDAMEDKLYLEHHEKSSAEMLGNVAEGVDVYVAEPSFSVGKSAVRDGITATKRTFGERGLGEGTPKSEGSDAGFCDDIFGDSPAGARKTGKGGGLPMERSGLHDNWDDAEGYYSYRFGEILDGRYEVIAAHGKGVFSTVVRAKDLKAGFGEPEEVAIKILRNKEAMYKAGVEELGILKTLVGADPEDKRHCVRFLSSFKYRNHLCLVFESLNMNLREVLKKFGRNIGLKLTAVRAYAKQLFIALKHLRNCGVLHCDIKPDNMLVNEAKNVLKLCDFGNAMYVGKNEITPYLVSRFYRAPEIILGLSYGHPLDMWSVGCCLYELYTGKVLFPGPSNNDMLRLHMELKGPFPKKMLRKGAFMNQHFDSELNFLAEEEDSVTKKSIRRMIVNIKPKDIGSIIKGSPGEDLKMLANFKDLLDKVFVLDPDKRMTVQQALNHPFITGK